MGGGRGCRGLAVGVACKLPYLLFLVPAIIAFLYVRQYGVNAPYNDGITLIPLFEKLFAGELGFQDLASQHNEHRIFFPRIALLLIGLATGFDDVAAMYAILTCLLFTALVLFAVFRSTVGGSPWLFVPVPFLVFNLGQSWNLLQGFQITLVFVQTFTVFSFALIHLAGTIPGSRRGLLAFCGALCAGMVATFSSAPGLLVWPLGLLQIFLLLLGGARAGGTERAMPLMLGVWSLSGAFGWTLYLRGYEGSETTLWRYTLENPQQSLEFLASTFGASLFHGSLDLAFAGGVALAGLAVAGLFLSYGAGGLAGLRRDSFWLAVLFFALLTALATTLARGTVPEDALNPKYATYTVLAPISVYAMLCGTLFSRSRRSAARSAVSASARYGSLCALLTLGVLAAAGLLLSYSEGIEEAREIEAEKKRTAFALYTYESQPDEILAGSGVLREHFRTDPVASRHMASFLERRGYSVFAESRPEVLPPKLTDPSPGKPQSPDGKAAGGIEAEVDTRLMRRAGVGGTFVMVTGWVKGDQSVNGVYVLVNGRPYPAFYGARSRTTEPAQEPGAQYFGLERGIPGSEIGPGPHALSVVAVTDTGEQNLDLGGGSHISFSLE